MSQPLEVSFEFFPPKTPEMEEKLWSAIHALAPLKPKFVSVTYGAGGTTRARTHDTVKRIYDETHLKPAAHLTCVGASRDELNQVANEYWAAGIKHIVALRGDPPKGSGKYTPHPEGYAYACDLMKGLRDLHDFEISVAAFPERHPESTSLQEDMDVLKSKAEAGATRAITQYFFDGELYLRLRDRVRKAGITIPVIPGIIPIGHFGQLKKFSAMCGASVPKWLEEKFAGLEGDHVAQDKVAVAVATELCKKLIAEGVEHLHFYTLNRSDLTSAVHRNLGINPAQK